MLRSYDPQLGRFLQSDPYDQFASGYLGMGDDPVNGVDEDGGCFGCTLFKNAADAANAANTLSGATVVGSLAKVGAKARAAAKLLSTVSASLSITVSVADATFSIVGQAQTKEDIVNRNLNKTEPQPARSFFNPPDEYTKNHHPALAGAQWLGNFLWEAMGAKDAELYIKNRISGYEKGDFTKDVQTFFEVGTYISRPGKPGKAGAGSGVRNSHLPPKQVVVEGDISIEHYYRSGDHAPAHLHVKGGGEDVRIGQNGKPLAGDAELSSAQKAVIQGNKAKIRSTVKKIMKFHKNGKTN